LIEGAVSALQTPDAPVVPQALRSAARDEAVTLRSAHRRELGGRALVVLLVGVLVTAFALTPPGKAAAEWLRTLAFGDTPTLQQQQVVLGTPIVLEAGELADGTPYEFVAKETDDAHFGPIGAGSGNPPIPDLICFQVDWPTLGQGGQGGGCTEVRKRGEFAIETPSLASPPNAPKTTSPYDYAHAPALYFGIVEHDDVADVKVTFEPQDGPEVAVPTRIYSVGAPYFDLGDGEQKRVFIALIDASMMTAGDAGTAQLHATALDASGHELFQTSAFQGVDCRVAMQRMQQVVNGDNGSGHPSPSDIDEAQAAQDALRGACGTSTTDGGG
jgi:hypothetical protein